MKSDKNEGDSGALLTRLASGAFGMLEVENVDSSSFFRPGTTHVVVFRNVLVGTPLNFVTFRVSVFALSSALSSFCASFLCLG